MVLDGFTDKWESVESDVGQSETEEAVAHDVLPNAESRFGRVAQSLDLMCSPFFITGDATSLSFSFRLL